MKSDHEWKIQDAIESWLHIASGDGIKYGTPEFDAMLRMMVDEPDEVKESVINTLASSATRH